MHPDLEEACRGAAACCGPGRRPGARRCRGRGAPGRRPARQPSACAVSPAPSTWAEVSLPPGAPSSAASAGWSLAGCSAAARRALGGVGGLLGRLLGSLGRGRLLGRRSATSARDRLAAGVRASAASARLGCAARRRRRARRGLGSAFLRPPRAWSRPPRRRRRASPWRRPRRRPSCRRVGVARPQGALGARQALELLPVAGHLEDRERPARSAARRRRASTARASESTSMTRGPPWGGTCRSPRSPGRRAWCGSRRRRCGSTGRGSCPCA